MSDWVTVTVRNSGGFVVNYTLDAIAGGEPLHYDPGNFASGTSKSTQLPADATDIELVIKDERAVNEWHTMHTERWVDASDWHEGAAIFEARGTTFHEHCKRVQ